MKAYKEIKILFEQAKRGTLPKDFKDWDLKINVDGL